ELLAAIERALALPCAAPGGTGEGARDALPLDAPVDDLAPPSAGRASTGGAARAALAGRHVLITSGPTHEPIDPVRYIANRSSGNRGPARAPRAGERAPRPPRSSGPPHLADPGGVGVGRVETAREMCEAARAALPADIAIFAAAVADWRVAVR